METTAIALFALIGLLGTGSPALAQKTSCKDIPLQWFIYQVAADDQTAVPAAISGDGNWYSASSGTSNTVIHVCGIEASRDATMLVGSRRKVAFGFTPPVTGSVIQESIPAGTYYDSPFMNVRNILCIGCADPHQPFTTRMGLQLKINNEDYRLRFMPTVTVAPDRLRIQMRFRPRTYPTRPRPYWSSHSLTIV